MMNDAPVLTESLREALEAFYEAYAQSSRIHTYTPGVQRSYAERVASEQVLKESMDRLTTEWLHYTFNEDQEWPKQK